MLKIYEMTTPEIISSLEEWEKGGLTKVLMSFVKLRVNQYKDAKPFLDLVLPTLQQGNE